ncbi:6-phosphogluconate dehydrogenase [Sphingomonas panacis]|uniref:6-phosphogluconate dehydrogenase n=1 Tax=Sphingomonas panacis TaxID=1560345 RepID=A0A1B3Z955_9SPHN|nr:NAD(P)-dependent oxidoreductase [Sphingomonas panacis]AOH83947.1 6-phosphogluconate dehydrogenase [Sphingomonas panacis]
MERTIALIGFGEAAMAFAPGLSASLRAYDIKTDHADLAAARRDQYNSLGVTGCDTAAQAFDGAEAVLSLVTADQALCAAESAEIAPGTLWFDMNSVAPDTKRAAAAAIHARGGRYVDVAVMSPVLPARTGVPLLVSGPHAEAGAAVLRALGFGNVRVVPGAVGRASSIKMIRSVMVKGLEALTAECVLAASQAGVLDDVLASLDASEKPKPWAERADYNLDRMLAHGLRRAAEMEEVVKTLDSLGTGSAMTTGTVVRQRAIGALGATPPDGLAAKLDLLTRKADAA